MPQPDEDLTRAAYDTVAEVYAEVIADTSWEQPVDLAMIDHFASLLAEPRHVLDAGCGAGRMLPFLAERGCQVEGIDLSPAMVACARRDHPGFRVQVGSLTALPHPDASFDGVFAWYSTIHSPDEDLDQVISEVARVLRPDGHLLLAFQTGEGVRRVGKGYAERGLDVVMMRHHRSAAAVAARLAGHQLEVVAQLDRGPVAGEADGQAVLVARRGR